MNTSGVDNQQSINPTTVTQNRQDITVDKIKDVTQTQKESVSKEEIQDAIEQLNEAVQSSYKELKFEFHEESERTMVKVIDSKEDEVIKEIPPKEVLDMLGKIKEMVGIIIDERI